MPVMTKDRRTGEIRPVRNYEIRLDPGSRDRPKSYAAPDKLSREEIDADVDEIVERMIRRGVIAR